MGAKQENRRWAFIESELFGKMIEYMYERVYDPKRSGHIKVKDFYNGTKMQTTLSDVMNYLEENSPIAGLHVELWREPTANGMIWEITKSDVHGPIYYPHVMPAKIDCDTLRERLVDGSTLKAECRSLNINLPTARKHARGNCECDNYTSSLTFDHSSGWVKSYIEDNSISNCHGSTD